MTGFQDIDGSMVMLGSPDLVGCAVEQLRDVLGEHPMKGAMHRLANLIPEQTPNPEHAREFVSRARKALDLVEQAVGEMTRPTREGGHVLYGGVRSRVQPVRESR